MNTTENNKLIAEFMGVTFINGVYGNCTSSIPMGLFTSDRLKYDYDWNWLMPVVEKIESLGFNTAIEVTHCSIDGTGQYEGIWFEAHGQKLEAVYKAVIEFINWYNQQKEKS